MSVSLITKGMICQGSIEVQTSQRFVLPLKLNLDNRILKINIKRNRPVININKSSNLVCDLNIQKSKINLKNKKLKLNIKRIC